jgi:hypothetical protein
MSQSLLDAAAKFDRQGRRVGTLYSDVGRESAMARVLWLLDERKKRRPAKATPRAAAVREKAAADLVAGLRKGLELQLPRAMIPRTAGPPPMKHR